MNSRFTYLKMALLHIVHLLRYSSGTEEGVAKERGPPVRPPFPPPDLQFQPWLPSEISPQLGGDLVFIWNFLHSFGSLLGLWTVTVPELLRALIDGEKSRFLGEMHISMLRIVQADMEEAHATGAMQVTYQSHTIFVK